MSAIDRIKAKIEKPANKASAKIEKLQQKLEDLVKQSQKKAAAKLASTQVPERAGAKRAPAKPVA